MYSGVLPFSIITVFATNVPLFSFFVTLVLNVIVAILVRRQKANRQGAHSNKFNSLLIILTGVSIVCMLPQVIINTKGLKLPLTAKYLISNFSDLMFNANSMINPIVYLVLMPDFRQAFRLLLTTPV